MLGCLDHNMGRRYTRLVVDTDPLVSFRNLTEERLAHILPAANTVPTRLHEAMRYATLAPGKRLRPGLCMASSMAVGGQAEDALDAGCAAELIHCFSLIHDDLPAIDNDDLRRGRPTCHVVYGEALAILAGDALFALAFETVASCSENSDRVARCVRVLSRATGSEGLVGGEVLDILSEGGEPDAAVLQVIHERKTGSLIATSCEMGAILGGGSLDQVARLADFGMAIGLGFQIADDILNETGNSDDLGKAVGSDRDLNKLTYPSVLGLERSREAAEECYRQALAHLEGLPGDSGPLRSLAEFAISRNH